VALDGSILDANAAALDCYGYSLAEMRARNVHDIRAPQDQDALDGQIRDAADHKVVFETVDRRSDGTLFPVEVQCASVSLDGETALLHIVRDISERKEAERELRESESRYRGLANASPLAVFVSRDEKHSDKVVLANTSCVGLFGASSPEDLIGTSAVELFHPDSQALARELMREATSEASPFVETRIVRLDGTPMDVEVIASAMRDQGLPAIQVTLRDVTGRKQAERELRESELRLQTIFELLPVGVSVLDEENRLAYTNPALERITGLSAEALRRGDYRTRTILDGNGDPLSPDGFASTRAVREGKALEVETGIVKEDGQVV
jgi:PAS domain S-box-containing protein